MLLWMCGCRAPKRTNAEKTFSPEKNDTEEKVNDLTMTRKQPAIFLDVLLIILRICMICFKATLCVSEC